MTLLRTYQTVFLAIAPTLIVITLIWWLVAQRLKYKLPFTVKSHHAILILILNAAALITLLAFGILWPSQFLFFLFLIGTVASAVENPQNRAGWLVFGYCLFTLCLSLF